MIDPTEETICDYCHETEYVGPTEIDATGRYVCTFCRQNDQDEWADAMRDELLLENER